MTAPNYSIQEARDLLVHMRNVLLFLNSGTPEHFLDQSITDSLLAFLEDKSEELDMILLMCANNIKQS